MMYIDKQFFEYWMQLIMDRFDKVDINIDKLTQKEDTILDSENLLDNEKLCHELNMSKRSLQRYRSSGLLPYSKISGKIFYEKSDVETFIRENLKKEISIKP